MAEILFAARDLESGYKQGDAIVVVPDGHVWGNAEGLPDFWQVVVPFDVSVVKEFVKPLVDPSEPGDPNADAPDDADKFELRHRALTRIDPQALVKPRREELLETGRVVLNAGQTRSSYKRLVYNKTTGQVEVTDQDVV